MSAIKEVVKKDYAGKAPEDRKGMGFAQAECYRHNTPIHVRKAIAEYHNQLQHSATYSNLHELVSVLVEAAAKAQREDEHQIVLRDTEVIQTVRQSGYGLQKVYTTAEATDTTVETENPKLVEDVIKTVCSNACIYWPELGPIFVPTIAKVVPSSGQVYIASPSQS